MAEPTMVILFCGIPGCGKTTIAKRLAKEFGKKGSVKIFISDALKPPVYRKFFRLLKENLGKYDYLIFDGTFYKRMWREKMFAIAKKGMNKVTVIYAACSLETAIRRNRRRRPRIPEKAIHIIFRQFEPPKKPDVYLDTDKLTVNQSLQKLKSKICGI